jgi:hypothetical protein
MDLIHRLIGRGEHTSDASPAERLEELRRKYAAVLFRLEQEAMNLETDIEGEVVVVRATVSSDRVRDEVGQIAHQIDENGLDLELHLEVDDRAWLDILAREYK